RLPILFLLSYATVAIFFFMHAQDKMSIKEDDIAAHEDVFTWTSTHSISGSKIRGFAVNQHEEKWYVTYAFESEKEKGSFLNQSLTGAAFLMKGQETELPLPAHEYGFDMHTYLKSHGAEGMLTIISVKQVSKPEGVTGWIAKQRFHMEKHIEL
ncbi:hypothetical protein JQK62_21875, partial [Leptospira santarosai]|nr:hypothetical protein [Leptospira santarosai]